MGCGCPKSDRTGGQTGEACLWRSPRWRISLAFEARVELRSHTRAVESAAIASPTLEPIVCDTSTVAWQVFKRIGKKPLLEERTDQLAGERCVSTQRQWPSEKR